MNYNYAKSEILELFKGIYVIDTNTEENFHIIKTDVQISRDFLLRIVSNKMFHSVYAGDGVMYFMFNMNISD